MRQKGFIFLPVIIIVISVGMIGYFIYQKIFYEKGNKNRTYPSIVQNPNTDPSKPLIKPSKAPYTSINCQSGWKVYSNEYFQLCVPDYLRIDQESLTVGINSPYVVFRDSINELGLGIYL